MTINCANKFIKEFIEGMFTLLETKTCYNAILIKIVWYWHLKR